MPTPKRPSARCAEGLSFRLGASLPKDGGDMVSIRSLYGEHPGHGWKGTAGGMGTAGSAYGAVPRGVERFGSFLRRSFACGARLPDRSSPILDSLYGKQPRHQTGLFFRVRRSSAWVLWALVVWAAGRTWRGHGIGTVRGWRAFFGGMGPCSSDMGVAICEDVAGFGRPAVRRKAGSVRSAHGSADPWPFFGMDV